MNAGVVGLMMHTRAFTSPRSVPIEYVGNDPVKGAPVISRNVQPVIPPQPEPEGYPGRSPGQRWQKQQVAIYRNLHWYDNMAARYDPVSSDTFRSFVRISPAGLAEQLRRATEPTQSMQGPIMSVEQPAPVPVTFRRVLGPK